jgi:hypothetical protein
MNNKLISIFKNVRDVSNPFNMPISYALNRIKDGNSKEIVEQIRSLKDKTQLNELKKQLPGVCFNGTFKHRSSNGLLERSGFMIIDFDDVDKAHEYKQHLIKDSYIYSAWISPSGMGVKVLVKIETTETHKGYFEALREHFNSPYWDDSGSNIDRFCFESYDPDIYINDKAQIWTKHEAPEMDDIGSEVVYLPVKSDNRIIDNLLTWWSKKYGMMPGQKNNNIYKLAASLNNFGISKQEAEAVCLKFDEGGKDKEIVKIVASAYKNISDHGTRFFEDTIARTKIEKHIRSGKTVKEISSQFSDFSTDEIEKSVEGIKETISIDEFWTYDKAGRIKLSVHKFKFWLQQNNFFKYFPTDSETYTFIRIDRNLIEETNKDRIKDFTLSAIMNRPEVGFMPYDMLAGSTKIFAPEFLNMIDSANIEMMQDTATECYLYYRNCAIRITEDKLEQLDYLDMPGYVWKKQIIDRDYIPSDHHVSEYRRFIWLIAGQNHEKYESFKSVIGYLIHSYKTSARNRAIILNDETISENPNGGSGKGLFCSALSKLKKVSSIDGKTFEFTKSFPYQTVSTDTQLLIFDDVKKNFAFESLFSLITEGITLEYKGQGAIKLPVQKSPKIVITTNYTLGGVGGSHERRKFEVELSDHFSHMHTPLDEFGHMLFEDWNEDEWRAFDTYMISCCQFYLKHGLVKHDFNNLEVRKFIKETSYEFYEWSEDGNIPKDIRLYKDELYDNLISDYSDLSKWLTKKRFTQWLNAYGIYKGMKILEGKTVNRRWIEYGEAVQDVWDDMSPKEEIF